jgi:1,4-dihydroxy-2-naphthoate octaprenyltransferase
MHRERPTHPALSPRTLLLAVRPWSFTMTAVAATAGSLTALLQTGAFNLGLYALTLLGLVLAHAATNLINDYFDTRYGVDKPGAPTTRYRPHPLIEGLLTPKQALAISLGLYALAALAGLTLVGLRGWPVALFALIGGLAGFTYTAGPVKYKYRALGEFAVFLMWGPLMVVGSYYVQTGSWIGVISALWVSLPIGLLVALVLLANNLKDLSYDRSTSVETLATLLGREGTLRLYVAIIIVVYGLSFLGVLAGALPVWGLLVLLSISKAWQLTRTLQSAPEIPPDADPQTAQLATIYGLWLTVGLLLAHFVPLQA